MSLYLNICNAFFDIKINDSLISNYIRNRYFGFIETKEIPSNKSSALISEVSLDELLNNYSFNEDRVCGDIYEYNEDGCKYLFVYSNIIVYDRQNSSVFMYISKEVPDKLLYLLGVKICEMITSILIDNGIYCMHSSVCTFERNIKNGIAFLGPSGVGKSSLVYQMYKHGEQITNDDVAYFHMTSSGITTYKNTQLIGFDDHSIETVFSECKAFISHKDGLSLDKNRIDLHKKDSNSFADKIEVRHVIIVDKIRLESPKLNKCNDLESYKNIVQSLVPYFTINRGDLIKSVVDQKED